MITSVKRIDKFKMGVIAIILSMSILGAVILKLAVDGLGITAVTPSHNTCLEVPPGKHMIIIDADSYEIQLQALDD